MHDIDYTMFRLYLSFYLSEKWDDSNSSGHNVFWNAIENVPEITAKLDTRAWIRINKMISVMTLRPPWTCFVVILSRAHREIVEIIIEDVNDLIGALKRKGAGEAQRQKDTENNMHTIHRRNFVKQASNWNFRAQFKWIFHPLDHHEYAVSGYRIKTNLSVTIQYTNVDYITDISFSERFSRAIICLKKPMLTHFKGTHHRTGWE